MFDESRKLNQKDRELLQKGMIINRLFRMTIEIIENEGRFVEDKRALKQIIEDLYKERLEQDVEGLEDGSNLKDSGIAEEAALLIKNYK